MERLYKFFKNIQNLKRKKRRGWLLHQIENSESTASHTFRTTLSSWVLGRETSLNTEKIIKMALVHDLCEALTFDETPYDPLLPKRIKNEEDIKKINEILEKWPEFTFEEKEEKVRRKRQREVRAFKKLVDDLPSALKTEMEELWIEFEDNITQEARFVNQVDKAENLLQGLEYWERYGRIKVDLWLRWAKGVFDNPLIIEFEKAIERRFVEKPEKRAEKMDKIVDFLTGAGRLKEIERRKWVFRKVPNPEKVADHVFSTALMTWVFSKGKNLNQKKLLKAALVHELGKSFLEKDSTPHFILFPNLREEIKEIMKEPFRFFPALRKETLENLKKKYKAESGLSSKRKEKNFEEEFKKERKSLERLIANLSEPFQEEILGLWEQYYCGLSEEGRFVQQVDILDNLFQASKYYTEDKNFPIESWWQEIGEKIEEPLLIEFIRSLYKKEKPPSK
jgi:putative hydrolase of HD superfamily